MDTIRLINGNKQPYNLGLPKIVILAKFNDVALNHLRENTGLAFVAGYDTIEAQPTDSKQIVALFMTYNFKTQFHNNMTSKNTLYLKSDHHMGFHVDSICYACTKANHIVANGLKPGDRLAC